MRARLCGRASPGASIPPLEPVAPSKSSVGEVGAAPPGGAVVRAGASAGALPSALLGGPASWSLLLMLPLMLLRLLERTRLPCCSGLVRGAGRQEPHV